MLFKSHMKYVLNKSTKEFVILPLNMSHSSQRRLNPTSAGFLYFYMKESEPQLRVFCFGSSGSLGIDSSPQDSDIITEALRNMQDYQSIEY